MNAKKWFLGGMGAVLGVGLLAAAGLYTNGLVTITAATVNGNPASAPGGTYTQLTASSLIPVDTNLTQGQNPATVAATAWQIASRAADMVSNTATSTAGAATLNTASGLVTTEALTTASGGTYTFTLTNSLFGVLSQPQVVFLPKSATIYGVQFTSSTCSSGSCVFVFTNTSAAAWNGTFVLGFHI